MLIRSAALLILSAILCGGCSYLNQKFGLPDDNMYEEGVEALIKEQYGYDIDLTP